MGELTDLLRAQSSRSQENFFFPDSGNPALVGLGLLDLTLGAPARTVQGGLINLLRGENVLTGMGRGFAGLGLDTGEFGQGEVASGFELLQELGVVEEQGLGNMLLGAGVDVMTDLAMFNLAGAARKAAGFGAKAPRVFGGHPGLRNLAGKSPRLLTTVAEEHRYKKSIMAALKPDQWTKVMRDLQETGVSFWNKPGSPGLFEMTKQGEFLAESFEKGASVASHHLKRGNIDFADEAVRLFNLTDVDLVFKADEKDLQKLFQAIYSPRPAKAGESAARGIATEMAPLRHMFDDLTKFEVANVNVVRKIGKDPIVGMQRPMMHFDVQFSDPKFLKGLKTAQPVNRPLKISMKAKEFRQSLAESLPPWVDFRDYNDVVKSLGGFDNLILASNRYVDDLNKYTKRLTDAYTEAGLIPGSDLEIEFNRVLQGVRWQIDGSAQVSKAFFKKYPHLARAYHKIAPIFDEIAGMELKFPDGRQVLDTIGRPVKNLPDAHRFRVSNERGHSVPGLYVPTQRTDFPGRLERDVIDIGGTKVRLTEDIPRKLFDAAFQRASGWSDMLNESLFDVAQGYIVAGLRRAHFQPALDELRPIMDQLNAVVKQGGKVKSQAAILHKAQNMVHHFVGGHYHRFDQMSDDLLRKIPGAAKVMGEQTRSATKFINGMIGLNFMGRIGFSLRTSLLQPLQLTMNNIMMFGFGDTLKGFYTFAKEGKDILPKLRAHHIWDSTLNEEFKFVREGVSELKRPGRTKTMKFWDVLQRTAFAPLQAMDNLNRGITGVTAYGMMKRMGYAEEFAIAKAIEASNAAHFVYSKLGSSPVKFHPLSRALFQFWSFGGKQLSFLADQARRDPLTSALRYIAVVGMMTRSVGKVVDIDRDLVPFSPGDIKNIVSMRSIPAYEPIRAVFNYGKALAGDTSVDVNFAREWMFRSVVRSVMPGGTQVDRLLQYGPTAGLPIPAETDLGVRTGGKGTELDKYGRSVRGLTKGEAWSSIFGFRSRNSTDAYDEYRDMAFKIDWVNHRKGYMMTQALRAHRVGRDPSPFLVEAYRIGGGSWSAIMQGFRQRIMNDQMSRVERTRRRAPQSVKALY